MAHSVVAETQIIQSSFTCSLESIGLHLQQLIKSQYLQNIHTHNRSTALLEFVWDHLGEQVPES